MTFYTEKTSNRLLDLLSLPVAIRCNELPNLFSRCGLRELQEVFPCLVQSIFGVGGSGVGWGMRTTTKENAPNCFNALVEFFAPMGPMFDLCYRLLNDVVKFEFNLELLPKKTVEFIHSGQHSVFYAELLNIDTFRRQITSLTLNAFDYYLLNFIVHAIHPLHKIHPASILVQNELHKTVYFALTTTYLYWFLPARPDHIVLPSNICSTVKLPQPLPVQPLQPKRSPKYLRIMQSPIYDTAASNNSSQMNSNSNASRANAWRSESALNLFIDVWLRYDVDETRDLPSSEFLRVVRELIIQVHAFANAVDMEQTSMKNLRKLARPMLRARFYTFIKSIIERWPLDSSLLVVLELWFSYIQPWRCSYTYQTRSRNTQISITNRFDAFIADNVVVYTQIFIMLLARFERLDFSSSTNVIMLHRLVEVFSQPTLTQRLYNAEESFAGSCVKLDSPSKQKTILNTSSANRDWDNCYNDEVYVPMFSTHIKNEIIEFIKIIYVSRMQIYHEIRKLRSEKKRTNFFKRYFIQLFENTSSEHIKLKEISRIPHILDGAIHSLSEIFMVDLNELSLDDYVPVAKTDCEMNDDLSLLNDSNLLDVSRLSPQQMKKKLINMRVGIDPALLPIQTYECKVLVRFLHQISCRINQIYGDGIQYYWNHSGLLGRIARQVLYAPMTAQWFDKPQGVCELHEEQLPARVCLRVLASYKFLSLIASTFIVGYLFWDAPILSLFLLFFLYILFILLMALMSYN